MDVEQKLGMSLDDLAADNGVDNGDHQGGGGGGGGRGGGRGQKRRGPSREANNETPGTIRVGRRVYVGNLSWKTSWQVGTGHEWAAVISLSMTIELWRG